MAFQGGEVLRYAREGEVVEHGKVNLKLLRVVLQIRQIVTTMKLTHQEHVGEVP